MTTRKEIFEKIFKTKMWGAACESASGPGSTLSATENLRKFLPKLIKTYKIKSIIDVPCGDMNWFSKIDIKGVKYYGFDIVEELIENNKKAFAKKRNYRFEVKDALVEKFPKADLILCRDLIIHFPITSVYDLMQNFVNSGSKYLLITQHSILDNRYKLNQNIEFGQFAFRNLTKPPFNFPLSDFLIPEEKVSSLCERYLAFYELSTIKEFLDKK